jgi:hypothetical protein
MGAAYKGVSKSSRTESITKSTTTTTTTTTTTINTRWGATQRVMEAKLTRLTHKIAIQMHLVVKSCTICSSRYRRPVRKLLDIPSYFKVLSRKIWVKPWKLSFRIAAARLKLEPEISGLQSKVYSRIRLDCSIRLSVAVSHAESFLTMTQLSAAPSSPCPHTSLLIQAMIRHEHDVTWANSCKTGRNTKAAAEHKLFDVCTVVNSETGGLENYVMRSFVTWALRQILFGWSNQRGRQD